ncbi:MAG: hypothetical protein ACRCRZ_02610 [Metamycoplasmataceae bacterium]
MNELSRVIKWRKYREEILKKKYWYLSIINSDNEFKKQFEEIKKIFKSDNISDFLKKEEQFDFEFLDTYDTDIKKNIKELSKKIEEAEKIKNKNEITINFSSNKFDALFNNFYKEKNEESTEISFKKIDLSKDK